MNFSLAKKIRLSSEKFMLKFLGYEEAILVFSKIAVTFFELSFLGSKLLL